MRLTRLLPDALEYPTRLANLRPAPVLTASGPLDHGRAAVAIVGSREPTPEAVSFTRELATHLARANVVVISGGALGIDTAAHEAALAHGTTWCVAPTGCNRAFPRENEELFERIAASATSRMIWPFADDQDKTPETPKERNLTLVALSRAVVVVQAHFKSGSRNAATHARKLGRPLWVVPAAPWMECFNGSLYELATGAQPLCHPSQLFRSLGLRWRGAARGWPAPRKQLILSSEAAHRGPPQTADQAAWSDAEKTIFSTISTTPVHLDEVVEKAGLSTSATITALLTLSLKDVVVEGPDGFFRRRSSE